MPRRPRQPSFITDLIDSLFDRVDDYLDEVVIPETRKAIRKATRELTRADTTGPGTQGPGPGNRTRTGYQGAETAQGPANSSRGTQIPPQGRKSRPMRPRPQPKPTYYETLGVLPTAEHAVIEGAYKALCKRYHPDRAGGDEEKMKRINVAWEVLRDPGTRAEYDKLLGRGRVGNV